jgi:hypothetical protein
MLRQLPLLIILSLSFQAHQALGQAKCKGYSPKGPGRGGQGHPGMAVIKVKPQPQYKEGGSPASGARDGNAASHLALIRAGEGRVRLRGCPS